MAIEAPDRAHPSMVYLGRVTEERFAKAFADGATVPLYVAADLLGVDEKTLRAMSDDGTVRGRRKGKARVYTERDLRTYLVEGPDIECREKKPEPTPHPRRAKVVLFSDIQARPR